MPAKFILGLKCRECGRRYDLKPVHICEYDFGPLEVDYDYEAIAKAVSREIIESRPKNMWRYAEFLPLAGDPIVGRNTGFTPLVRAERLGKELGLKNLWIKNDAVNYPTLSFKDRVVSVALSKAKEFGFDTVACATTGNLGNSVAAQSIRAGLECFIFMPANLEQGKIIGTSVYGVHVVGIGGNYDGVNRLCSEIGNKFGWAFANINMRPYYSEGSKTYGMELCEQLGWKAPDHVIVPMAGGSLICKIKKAVDELHKCGLIDSNHTKIYGAQAAGCAPISTAVKKGWELFKPVKPDTIARSIAIGNPADGFYAIKNITGSGGWSEDVTDEELVEGIKLLARTEGIFTETAGGVTVAVTKKLVEQGRLPAGDTVVISVTGNGLKTIEAVMPAVPKPDVIEAKLSDFEALVEKIKDRSKAAAPAAAGG
ncbi:MAG: threonine synthase [Planctomycetota bacterium]|nr:threonine synthase [Planctomycetota bacterium]